MPALKKAKSGYKEYILNCIPSKDPEEDWTYADAAEARGFASLATAPVSKDLRESWWTIRDQGLTGACVGFATADGLLRWHYVKAGKISQKQMPAPRFIWMANKETDEITTYPTTFLETEGTQTKLALAVARKFGCVMEEDLPMTGTLSFLSRAAFYSKAAHFRIASYHNLKRDLSIWKKWLAFQGPILTRLNVDRTWDNAARTRGVLQTYYPKTVRGGHAVALVGYTSKHFIVRNSWGTSWGDRGFGYASYAYTKAAFTEAYGLIM